MTILLINHAQQPIDERHIGWRVIRNESDNTISLYEIVERKYAHPEKAAADAGATIFMLELVGKMSAKISEIKASGMLLLETAQNNLLAYVSKASDAWKKP